jgi:hypothetical protein
MYYAGIGQQAQILATEIASLLPGRPALARQGSLSLISGISPATAVTLPGIPRGRVTLGPGRPRMIVFFATWLAETSDLRGNLLSLNSYVAAARGGKLPGLVAVDEGATEPSASSAATFLAGLGKPLAYPVAVDSSGRVADGYQVIDQPWFALVSASGKIVWSHDGWLSAQALEAAAKKG